MATKPAEEIPWISVNNVLKTIPIKSNTTWAELIVAEKKETKEKYLRLRRFKQAYSIKSAEDLASMIEVLQLGAQELGWQKGLESLYQKFTDEVTSLRQARIKDKERIQEMTKVLSELRETQMSLELPTYKEHLAEFKRLMKNSKKEQELQEFLENHVWMFGMEYIETQLRGFSQFELPGTRFDFLLQRYDTFYDIIELKQPKVNLFDEKPSEDQTLLPTVAPSRKTPISQELKNAISQMIDYLEAADDWAPGLLKRYGVVLHKPKGIIVIGRREDYGKAIKTLNYYFNHFQILTYDDIYDQASEFVKRIGKRKVQKK
ncbi:Shedu anti-phage system protein SduA domain-containing protein [Nitrososphaera sp.]|uniref:Shedu anti-phage system protein SduA domain-containing protein n=1 Tax=Nitrososphaera sp. TaxID=1971748 RepID=UPI001835B237|nr:Shedu anti-phage system protein SduA domain-containing protein [Nitrososphaera sp.]NWG36011.1 DUF4263 domain-containing protein [Nitrososphaera sp.]